MAKKDLFAEQFRASFGRAMASEDQARLEQLKHVGHEYLTHKGINKELPVATVATPKKGTVTTVPTDGTVTTSVKDALLKLAPSRVVFLRHVLNNRALFGGEYVPWARVTEATGLTSVTLMRLAKELVAKGIIRTEFDTLKRRGTRISLVEAYANELAGLPGFVDNNAQEQAQGKPTVATVPTVPPVGVGTVTTVTTGQPPLDRLEKLRRIYLSDKPEEIGTWPNLVDIGLTEEMLLEDIDIREEKGVPASLFDEDMAILNYNFGQPEWVKKIRTKPLRYLRVCIVQGNTTPAPGYESPVQARIKAIRARREAREQELKELETEEIALWWLELPADQKRSYTEKFKHAPEDNRKQLAWNEWRKGR